MSLARLFIRRPSAKPPRVLVRRARCCAIAVDAINATLDELQTSHDTVMLEACNASCQFHLQVSAEEFAHFYNAAQAVLAPVLAAVAITVAYGRKAPSSRRTSSPRMVIVSQSTTSRSIRF